MQNTIFKSSSLLRIIADVIENVESYHSFEDAIKSIDLQKFVKILEDRKYLKDEEYKILYESYELGMSTRQIAKTMKFSHSHVASLKSLSIKRLAAIYEFFISTEKYESLEIEDLVDADFNYNRSITDALTFHSRKRLISMYARLKHRDLVFFKRFDLSDDQFDRAKSEIKRVLGFEGILSRQFIESVKENAAFEFGVNQIELVGSYRRNEATEESDVDFLILDKKAPYGIEFLKMITYLKEHLGKEVGLLHKNSMTRERDKAIIESMLEDIRNYE